MASLLKATGYSVVSAISINGRVFMQLVLDLLFLSPWHPLGGDPTVLTQARITLVVQIFSLAFMTGVTVWFFAQLKEQIAQFYPAYKSTTNYLSLFRPVLRFKRLVKHSLGPLFEVVLRNGVYLWFVVDMVQMGQEYAAAWYVDLNQT
ncbi:hypothetical protein SARC_00175 [Sphaeroforma arctica JP610]|uniref:Uncharacterized protein n=1 Tax=Sphaeroforma arctica JP610 TaxID=667725 RepID=A0A0L0GFY4_9EUKA|nr:hypothetical protein SARC_00175 [Sphaeroforma arctica JP610]KNC87741.1 hypothetical protein SARC_00175 [Sphaeroforma arctica JP610]|eukprot:XP_014161643.1 hypothetical protein SARC_00175 [Sphaeroforma arctica JP610]